MMESNRLEMWRVDGGVVGEEEESTKHSGKKRFQFRNCNQSSICRFHMHASINLKNPNYFRASHMRDSLHRVVFRLWSPEENLGPLIHLNSWGWPSRFYDCTRPDSDCTKNNVNAHVLAREISRAGSKRASRIIPWQHRMMNSLSMEEWNWSLDKLGTIIK